MNRQPSPDLSQRLRDAIAASLHALHAAGASEAPLMVPRASTPVAPGRLAAAHPGPARARLELAGLYQRCLQHYRRVVRSGDADTADDLGAALAHFVVANLRVLHGIEPPAGAECALGWQLVAIVRGSPAWQRAPLRDRQAYAEQLAILSVLMSDLATRARREGPASVAHVQQGARGYLRQLLGLDPDALTLDVSGLAVRDAALAA